MVHIKIFSIVIKPVHVPMDYHSDIVISYHHHLFWKCLFFPCSESRVRPLGVCPNMKSLQSSLNTAHSGCKSSSFMASFSFSYPKVCTKPHFALYASTPFHTSTSPSYISWSGWVVVATILYHVSLMQTVAVLEVINIFAIILIWQKILISLHFNARVSFDDLHS